MPPLNTIKWRAEFYYTTYTSGAEFWQKEGKRWAKETDRFADPSKALKECSAKTRRPQRIPMSRRPQDLRRSDEARQHRFHARKNPAPSVKTEKLKADQAMPKMCGHKRAALPTISRFSMSPWRELRGCVCTRCRWSIATGPSSTRTTSRSSQLDDYIAIVVLNGKEVYLDPGQKMCPFGLLHWKHTFASGLGFPIAGRSRVTTPVGRIHGDGVQRVARSHHRQIPAASKEPRASF